MSPTHSTTLLHPLDTNDANCSRRTSISSINDEDWRQLLSQFDSQPDIMVLIQLCKEEEDKRRYEENKMKLKEYQVYCELQKNHPL
ncbi:hypothetical protein G6F57_005881 [Rhizopus arrhizus]|jgi:hypothetical protein|uniref:Uncharacterized protein n=1 Tax=Rhizopus oryzae TaxID=64495 RepID=A0A9P7BT77_RHIOR|nr:hypothetical protein G6F23_001345 [Rhizopus arrhizus]KAG1056366.1 hypothetical protein G6F43_001734 [Rhizopus delemar]KAG0764041.1 hypothetical protein G6F24_005541 [Rhizopus arrhizus]KAG0790641.1 hypothetical protein G6F21_005665 [Rhizopus arrhizus]KAG0800219.1 hypothetical protein G6F22_002448 [Rhizopus arrhizus]